MTQLTNTFDTGVGNGLPMTLSNSNDNGAGNAFEFITGNVVYDTSVVLHGTSSVRLSTALAGETAYFRWVPTPQASEIWIRIYFRVSDDTPVSNYSVIDVNGADLTTGALEIHLRQDRRIRIRIPATFQFESSPLILPNVWHRLEVHAKMNPVNYCAVECRVFYGDNLEGLSPNESFGNINQGILTSAGATFGRIAFGLANTPDQAMSMWLDSIGYSDVGWFGSAAPAETGVMPVAAVIGMYAGDGSAGLTIPAGFGFTPFGTGPFGT